MSGVAFGQFAVLVGVGWIMGTAGATLVAVLRERAQRKACRDEFQTALAAQRAIYKASLAEQGRHIISMDDKGTVIVAPIAEGDEERAN
jgi:hypothetical protein